MLNTKKRENQNLVRCKKQTCNLLLHG